VSTSSVEMDYRDTRVVVTGAASGMGRALVDQLAGLGAEIIALDISPVAPGPWTAFEVDLGSQASIDAVLERIGRPVDRLFNVAGVAGGRGRETVAMMVNFYGVRHLTERLLPAMPRGGAVVSVSSLAGYRYMLERDALREMLALSTMDQAVAWLDDEANQSRFNGYGTSKELLNLWTALSCRPFAEAHGVRINAIAPGVTETPLLEAFRANAIERTGSDEAVTAARGFLGRIADPQDQAAACVFLNSSAATMITGQVLGVDGGMSGAINAGALPTPGVRGR
jgi:NAD(P)-dependent dehydrogenase (short-subunit alcohol dehydrogenase family)